MKKPPRSDSNRVDALFRRKAMPCGFLIFKVDYARNYVPPVPDIGAFEYPAGKATWLVAPQGQTVIKATKGQTVEWSKA